MAYELERGEVTNPEQNQRRNRIFDRRQVVLLDHTQVLKSYTAEKPMWNRVTAKLDDLNLEGLKNELRRCEEQRDALLREHHALQFKSIEYNRALREHQLEREISRLEGATRGLMELVRRQAANASNDDGDVRENSELEARHMPSTSNRPPDPHFANKLSSLLPEGVRLDIERDLEEQYLEDWSKFGEEFAVQRYRIRLCKNILNSVPEAIKGIVRFSGLDPIIAIVKNRGIGKMISKLARWS